MASFNKVILMGRLVAAPELKTTPAGLPVTSFTLAVDRKYNKDAEKKADFISVVAWRQTAEFICKYFGKGSAIIICGELQTRSWTDNDGKKRYATEVMASEVSFAESKKSSEAGAASDTYDPDGFQPVDPDEDLPF